MGRIGSILSVFCFCLELGGKIMPFVRIQLKEGRTTEQKEKMAEEIIEIVHKYGNAARESIRVIYEEMAPDNFYSGAEKK